MKPPTENRGGRRAGAGAKPIKPALRRTKLVAMRVTEAEYEALLAMCELEGGEELSSWLRERVLAGFALDMPTDTND